MERSTIEILNELGIRVHSQKGDNYIIQCPSPTHEDKRPSCSVDIATGMFHCFSCGYGGGIHTLYKHMTGNKLKSDYSNTGYDTYNYVSKESKKVVKPKGDIELVDGEELSVFDNPRVMKYLESIGVSDEETIFDLEIKYTRYARYKSKYTPKLGSNGKENKGTAFVNRIIFPIYDENETLVNLEGRTFVGDTPKVLYVKNGLSDFVYNLDRCDPSKPLVVNEGLKNLLKIRNVEPNVVSIFGSNFSIKKQQLLIDRGFTDLILFLDNDRASFAMADKLDTTWDYDFRVCHSDVEGEDASDLTLRGIRTKINNSIDYGQWLMSRMRKEIENNEERYW